MRRRLPALQPTTKVVNTITGTLIRFALTPQEEEDS
jgi:hypothetical protein